MNTLAKSASLAQMGLPVGEHLVRLCVSADVVSFEVETPTASPLTNPTKRKPSGFLQKWGGSMRKIEDPTDPRLTHINQKHLR